jgi:hypothetical protein
LVRYWRRERNSCQPGPILARIDRKRKKKGSNDDWKHPHDPDAKITKMKDGRTHLAHKAEHAVDLETGVYISEPERRPQSWIDQEAERDAVYANRRRIRGDRGRRLLRKRLVVQDSVRAGLARLKQFDGCQA